MVRQTLDRTMPSEPLSWARYDVEQQLMFRGGRFTRVNSWCSFAIAIVSTVAMYAALFPFREGAIAGSFFFERNRETPACIVFLSCWSLAILGLKWIKLRMQYEALKFHVVPDDP